jgi:hypothetical protein
MSDYVEKLGKHWVGFRKNNLCLKNFKKCVENLGFAKFKQE